MNIQRWKGIIWFGSLVVGGLLGYYVYDFLQRKEVLEREVPDEELSAVLDGIKKPEEQKTDHVAASAMQRVFFNQDWTGLEKVKPVAQTGNTAPTVAPKVRVETLLKVLAIKVDTSKPDRSVAFVKFVDPKLAVHEEHDDTVLKPGEHLFPPYQDVYVDAITADGVVFAFDDAERPKETVPTVAYQSVLRGDLGIVMVGEEGVIMPQSNKRIELAPAGETWHPEQLMQVRKGEWQVGTQTLVDLDRDYSRILSQDISASTYKDPRTGQAGGIKINRVAPNSIPAQAGLTEGEVLKSINGHKVTSVNDAVAYVKANAESTTTWTAVFEKQGREFTRVYHSP